MSEVCIQTKIERIFKLATFGTLVSGMAYCFAVKGLYSKEKMGVILLLLDSDAFCSYFHVGIHVYISLLLISAVLVGITITVNVVGYLKRLWNSFKIMGPSWHHYFFVSIIGVIIGLIAFGIIHLEFRQIYIFGGDLILIFVLTMVHGAFMKVQSDTTEDNLLLPEDIIGVSTTVEYISRRIARTFEDQTGALPKTMAISGGRGSGKSYILELVGNNLKSEMSLNCKIFKPWNFDSHILFYEGVMKYLFSVVEEKYVVPKPRDLVKNYVNSFCRDTKSVVSAFIDDIFGSFLAEKRTLKDAEEWIANIGNIVLVFDDLDRCHQGELRHVLRLMDRLAIFPNIFLVAAIDDKTMEKIGKFDERVEIPVKVTI